MVGWTIQSDVFEFLQITENLLNVPSKIETSMLAIYPAGQSSTIVSHSTSCHFLT